MSLRLRTGAAMVLAAAFAASLAAAPRAFAEDGSASSDGAGASWGPGLEVYGAFGHAALAGNIYGSNGAMAFGGGLNSWYPGRRSSNWGGFLGLDISSFAAREARAGTSFPFQVGQDLRVLRSTLSLNVCRGFEAGSRLCLGIGYALLSMTQSSYEQEYGVPVYALTFKHPLAERWLVGATTDWSALHAKVAGTSSSQEFWRSQATVGYLF